VGDDFFVVCMNKKGARSKTKKLNRKKKGREDKMKEKAWINTTDRFV
jgi:hypothetical protein